MQEMTVSEVSRSLGISTRMLRYYENAGLVTSRRREGYAYRIYDEEAVGRLGQIMLLRKLRFPVKQIREILGDPGIKAIVDIFAGNIRELDDEIDALQTIRNILLELIRELYSPGADIKRLLAANPSLQHSVPPSKKEDNKMDGLNRAEEKLSTLKDVRIITLPPATVASIHCQGENPEDRAQEAAGKFVLESGLLSRKPDLRNFGFNHPNPTEESDFHGYEVWVTIPDGMEVPPPLTKKKFAGGLYAAHTIAMGNFHEWTWLDEWVKASGKYEFAGDMSDQEHMCGLLEEHLNYTGNVQEKELNPEEIQLDLLMPVSKKDS